MRKEDVKIGQRVKVVELDEHDIENGFKIGEVLTVENISASRVGAYFEEKGTSILYFNQLELCEEQTYTIIEILSELSKDSSKKFIDEDGDIYSVNENNIILFNGSYSHRTINQLLNSDDRYTELKPFKDRLKDGDDYYFFTSSLEVYKSKFSSDFKSDAERVAIGNVFETKKECLDVVNKIKELLGGE